MPVIKRYVMIFALALLLPCFFTGQQALAGDLYFAGSGPASFLQERFFPHFLALGGRGAVAFGEADSAEHLSPLEQIFSGSFIGALLFGYPYSGMGTVDIVSLAVLGLLVFRAVTGLGRKNTRQKDRFTVHTRDENSTQIPDSYNRFGRRNEQRPEDPEDHQAETRNEPVKRKLRGGDPHDNPWSRRMGGQTRAGKDRENSSPWRSANSSQTQRASTAADRARQMWAHLSSESEETPFRQAGPAIVAAGVRVPDDFDVADFLDGARALYVRLQEAWARRDLSSLEGFLTADMMALLQKQAARSPEATTIEVLLVEATLKGIERSSAEEARVLFKALIRSGGASEPVEAQEEWRFYRGADSNGMWRLAGIQGA